MKISKLFVLSALWLAGLSANAADLTERLEPTNADVPQTAVAFQAGKTYLLYNTGTKLFYTQGNSWGTRASIGPLEEAIRVHLDEYAPEGQTLEEVTYQFFNYSCVRSRTYSWHQSWFDSAAQMYTDLASQANKYWALVDMGGNTYRLKAAQLNPDIKSDGTQFVGRDDEVAQDASNLYADLPNDEIFPLTSLLTEGEGHHVDWVFFDAVVFDVYDKSQELKELIETAEDEGVDVSAYVAVYNNLNATLEQIEEAILNLKKDRSNNVFGSVVNGQRNDVTEKLFTNPNYDNNNNDGWSGTTPGFQSYTNAEFFNKNYDYYQSLGYVPAGVYALGLKAFYRAGSTADSYTAHQTGANLNGKIYAKLGDETQEQSIVNIFEGATTSKIGTGAEVTAGSPELYVPNNMQAAGAYFDAGRYQNNMLFEAAQGAELTVGLKKTTTISEDWTIWDSWTLYYYGTGAEAFQAWLDDAKSTFPDYESQRVPAESPFFNTVGLNYTTAYMEAFKEARPIVTNREEAQAGLEKLKKVFAELEENIGLWADYLALAKRAAKLATNEAIDKDNELVQDVISWSDLDGEDDWNAQEMTNDELREFIAQKTVDVEEAEKCYVQTGGEIDVTFRMVNPDFEQGSTGWTRVAAAGGNVKTGGTATNTCYEAWNNASFDIYQVVKDVPTGIYRIEVQGFYRYGRGDAWNDYREQKVEYVQPGGAPVFVYLNSKTTPLTNIFGDARQITDEEFYKAGSSDYSTLTTDEGETFYFPNGMASAAIAFEAGMYKQSAYGIIREGEELRIGVKGSSNQLGDSWPIWDNFKLYSCGTDAQAVTAVLTDEIEQAKAMLDQNMSKTVYNKLKAAVEAAQASLETEDGEVMFNALSALFEAEEGVAASVALFDQLYKANKKLIAAVSTSTNTTAMAEGGALYAQIGAALASHTLEDADVEAYIIKIKTMITKLRLPSDYKEASDLCVVEASDIIANNSYDLGLDDWDGTAAAWGGETNTNAELFNKTYDYYQDIYGVPAGTYDVVLQGFYRSGEVAADYESRDDVSASHAFLYADGGEGVSSVPLKRLGSEAQDGSGDGWAEVATGAGLYVPNTMTAAAGAFVGGMYAGNTVTVKVNENGILRVGLKKETAVTNDWTLWDNWQLLYYGTESTKSVSGDASGIDDVNAQPAVKVEFFTLDGRKANAAQKGIVIQKMTMGNGAVVIKKIRK